MWGFVILLEYALKLFYLFHGRVNLVPNRLAPDKSLNAGTEWLKPFDPCAPFLRDFEYLFKFVLRGLRKTLSIHVLEYSRLLFFRILRVASPWYFDVGKILFRYLLYSLRKILVERPFFSRHVAG